VSLKVRSFKVGVIINKCHQMSLKYVVEL